MYFLPTEQIGADGEQAASGTLRPLAGGEGLGRVAHVMEGAAVALGGLGDGADRAEAHVQSARHVEPGIQSRDDLLDPMLGQHTAGIDDADDHRLAALGDGLFQGQIGNAEIGGATLHPELADAPFRPPVIDAVGGLGGEPVGHVAEEHQVGGGDLHGSDVSPIRSEAPPENASMRDPCPMREGAPPHSCNSIPVLMLRRQTKAWLRGMPLRF